MAGRPKFDIDNDVLEFYLGLKFTRKEVADILGISLRTVGTLIKEYGLKSRDKYNQMNDEELDEMMELVVLENQQFDQWTKMTNIRLLLYPIHYFRNG